MLANSANTCLPVRTYSSGMMTRLNFALATSPEPGVLLMDEGIATADARFAERASQRVKDLIGRSRIVVSMRWSARCVTRPPSCRRDESSASVV